MTHHRDVASRRDLVARWCLLAERRLQYLTELFESGRWRRYYGELAFLENIQEAKNAVETWRDLAGRPSAHKDDAPRLSGQDRRLEPAPLASAPPTEVSFDDVDRASAENVPSAPVDLIALERALAEMLPPAFDPAAIEQRYPLLRNAL
jgi:uncharacterized repeat protein (TIGR03809 family)